MRKKKLEIFYAMKEIQHTGNICVYIIRQILVIKDVPIKVTIRYEAANNVIGTLQ